MCVCIRVSEYNTKKTQENERKREKKNWRLFPFTPRCSPPILSVFRSVHTPISGSCSSIRLYTLYISYCSVMYIKV